MALEHDTTPGALFFSVLDDIERPDSILVEFFAAFRSYLDAHDLTDLTVTPGMSPEWRAVLLAVQAMPASLRRALGLPVPERSCRLCGCTDEEGCPDPYGGRCWWVELDPPLCSVCARAAS